MLAFAAVLVKWWHIHLQLWAAH